MTAIARDESVASNESARGIIVYGRDGYEDRGPFVEQAEAMTSEGEVDFAIADEIAFGITDGELEVIFPNGRVSTTRKPAYRWAMMRTSDWKCALALEQTGIRCFPSSDYIRIASDKALTHLVMSDVRSLNTLIRAGHLRLGDIPVPFMVKETTGYGGSGVTKVTSSTHARIREHLRSDDDEFICQQLATTPDDLRVYVMDGEPMLAILRKAKEGSDKANFCEGAVGEIYELRESDLEQLNKVLSRFPDERGFISIDFLFDADGNVVLNEMNCFPGLLGLVQMGMHEGFVERYAEHLDEMTR